MRVCVGADVLVSHQDLAARVAIDEQRRQRPPLHHRPVGQDVADNIWVTVAGGWGPAHGARHITRVALVSHRLSDTGVCRRLTFGGRTAAQPGRAVIAFFGHHLLFLLSSLLIGCLLIFEFLSRRSRGVASFVFSTWPFFGFFAFFS